MQKNRKKAGLFPALLKYWRHQRGMSQLDLATATDVSSRHVSFLETGRAQPSEEMVLLLASSLDIPLRNQNEMLHAAGFNERYKSPSLEGDLESEISFAIEHMLTQHEPFPLVIMNHCYDVLRMNRSMERFMQLFIKEPAALSTPINGYRVLFDPRLARTSLRNWDETGRQLLSHLHRESLHHPEDTALRDLVEELLAYPDIPADWRQPDFQSPSPPAFHLHFQVDNLEVAFLTTITSFNAPNNVTLEELRIESYFPLDSATEAVCKQLAEEPSGVRG